MSQNVEKEALGARIKKIRQNLGMTLEEFGKIISPPANRSLVSAWENGRYVPNNQRLKAIAELADISVDELLHGSVEEQSYNYLYDLIQQGGLTFELLTQLSKALGIKKENENISLLARKTLDEFLPLDYIHVDLQGNVSSINDKESFEEAFNYFIRQKIRGIRHSVPGAIDAVIGAIDSVTTFIEPISLKNFEHLKNESKENLIKLYYNQLLDNEHLKSKSESELLNYATHNYYLDLTMGHLLEEKEKLIELSESYKQDMDKFENN